MSLINTLRLLNLIPNDTDTKEKSLDPDGFVIFS